MSILMRVVYSYAPDRYEVIQVPETTQNSEIHRVIADFENDSRKSLRNWKTTVRPGFFNIKKIKNSKDAEEEKLIAIKHGLTHEPVSLVYKRYRDELNKRKGTSKSFGETVGNIKPQPSEDCRDLLSHFFNKSKDKTHKNYPRNKPRFK